MKRNVAVATAMLVVVAGLAVAMGWRPWQDELPDDAAFVIGDDVVTVADLDRRNDSLRALYGVQEPLDDKARKDFQRQAAKSMAISMVLDEAVDDAGIEVPDVDVAKALRAFIAAQFEGDRKAFIDSLAGVSSSGEAVRDEIRRQLALRLLLEEVAGDVKVSEADLRAAFAERRDRLALPERRAVSNLVLSTRAAAADVRRQLDAGASVATLARAVSIDAATRDKGGVLGAVTQEQLVPAVGAAVFGTGAGRPYGPVHGPQGWNVGVVTRVLAPVTATLRGVRARLRAVLESEASQQRWTDWLEQQLRDAEIEYADDYRPDDPYDVSAWEQQQAAGATSEGQP